MSGPLGDRAAQARLKRREQLARLQYEQDLAWVMKHPSGRRFVYSIIDGICGIHNRHFAVSSMDRDVQAGRRDVGLQLLVDAQTVAPTEFVHHIQERLSALAKERDAQKAAELDEEAKAETEE